MQIESTQSPDETFKQLRDEFFIVGKEERHPFRFFNLSTVKAAGRSADSRMVVLRAYRSGWEFEFYTDFRSRKVKQIQKFPKISALFWDAENRIQVRIGAVAEIHHKNRVANERWRNVPSEFRKEYAAVKPPGRELSGPEDAHRWEKEENNTNFAVIICRADRVRLLQLAGGGHLAVESHRINAEEKWQNEWIAP